MKKLFDYLDLDIECDSDTDEDSIKEYMTDLIYDDFPLLYHSFHNENAIQDEIDVEMDCESYGDGYHISYYYHMQLSEKIEELFAIHYPEKLI